MSSVTPNDWSHRHLCYAQAAVWLKYSECLSALGRISEAADAYGIVVEMAPNHVAARVQLSLLQQQLGLDAEALHTLAEGGGGWRGNSLPDSWCCALKMGNKIMSLSLINFYMDSSSYEIAGHHCKLFQCVQKQECSPKSPMAQTSACLSLTPSDDHL